MTALDNAVTVGLTQGNIDAQSTRATATAGGPEAILIGPGLYTKCGHLFSDCNAPAPVLLCDCQADDPIAVSRLLRDIIHGTPACWGAPASANSGRCEPKYGSSAPVLVWSDRRTVRRNPGTGAGEQVKTVREAV